MINKLLRLFPLLLMVLYFACQIPFLAADPDTTVDIHTRGAWTDEGLYSGTARNFLNYGTIDLQENSLLTRGPLQTVIQIPLFFVFGQTLLVARLMTLAGVLLALFLMLQRTETQTMGMVFLAVGFTQFHLFHFSHYAMAEALGTAFILIAVCFTVQGFEGARSPRTGRWWLMGAALLLFGAYALKIQFLYVAALLPGYALLRWLFSLFRGHYSAKAMRYRFLFVTGWTLALAGVYVLAWYLPNQEFYHFVMSREVDSRFPSTLVHIWGQTRFNFEVLLFVPYLRPLIIAWLLALLGGSLWLIFKPSAWKPTERAFFLLALLWFFLEVHKVSMTYMPHRYLVPMYAAMGLLIAVTASVLIRRRGYMATAAMVLVALMAGWQLRHTHEAYQNRTFELREVNRYLKQYDWDGKTIAGAWGPSAAWGTGAKVYPVWHGFVNDHRALEGAMIITEHDQADSDMSLIKQGIVLEEHTDSTRVFPAWRYTLVLHWLKEEGD